MTDLPTLLLDQLAFVEINYQYELLSAEANGRPPQCLLLFGYQSTEKIVINRCCNIPLSLKSVNESCANFEYDYEQLKERIELIECTNPTIKPQAVIVMNDSLYDYHSTLKRLKTQEDGVQYLFTYTPHSGRSEELQLYCHSMDLICGHLTMKRVHYELRSLVSNVDLGLPKSRYNVEEDEITNEEELTVKLAGKIDQMIDYLKNTDDIDPELMRNISLLVSRIRRPPTDDIEEEILNKENDISTFRIACEQWEIGTCLLRSKLK